MKTLKDASINEIGLELDRRGENFLLVVLHQDDFGFTAKKSDVPSMELALIGATSSALSLMTGMVTKSGVHSKYKAKEGES